VIIKSKIPRNKISTIHNVIRFLKLSIRAKVRTSVSMRSVVTVEA
jgi:hypothetical protein